MTNPVLELYLGGSSWTVVPSSDLVKRSIQINRVLYRDLEPATSSASLEIRGGAPIIHQLLALNNTSIPMRIKDGNTTRFTGYLTDNYTWDVRTGGESNLRVSAEDVGIKKLKVSTRNIENSSTPGSGFIQWLDIPVCDPSATITANANSFVHRLCYYAIGSHSNLDGDPMGISLPIAEIMTPVDIIINDDTTTWWDVAAKVLGEFGYTFYFDRFGRFCLYNNWHSEVSGTPVINGSNIISDGSQAIKVKKNLVKYTSARVKWKEVELVENEVLFEDITGGDDKNSCNILLEGNYASYPVDVEDNYDISMASWVDYQCLSTGKELVRASNVKMDYSVEQGSPNPCYYGASITAKEFGPLRGRFIIAHGGVPEGKEYSTNITKLRMVGDALVIKSLNTSIVGEDISKSFLYESSYLRSKEQADYLANLYYEYYSKSNYNYQFSSPEDLALGSIITLMDDTFSGLVVQVLITKKIISDAPYYTYEAHGVSGFSIYPSIIQEYNLATPGPRSAQEMPKGYSVRITTFPSPIFKRGEVDTITLTATAYLNSIDITDSLPDHSLAWSKVYMKDGMRREESLPNGKEITITGEDLFQRATYNVRLIIY